MIPALIITGFVALLFVLAVCSWRTYDGGRPASRALARESAERSWMDDVPLGYRRLP